MVRKWQNSEIGFFREINLLYFFSIRSGALIHYKAEVGNGAIIDSNATISTGTIIGNDVMVEIKAFIGHQAPAGRISAMVAESGGRAKQPGHLDPDQHLA